jgi:CBS domain-containing protein
MNDTIRGSAAPRQLEIGTVEVITGRGRSITLSSVRCPVRARTSPVEECAHCGRSAGIAQDVLARGAWVSCEAPSAAEPPGASPPVREVMRRAAVAVRPRLPAATAATALGTRGQPGAPVVDGEGRPVGWVAVAELLRARRGASVAEVMERAAIAVGEGAPLSRAAALLVANGLERVAVVSSDGIVVGVLSALDLVGALAEPERLEA